MIVVLAKSAAKEIEDLPETHYFRIKKSILALAEDPYPQSAKKLSGRALYRLRVGPYRIVCEVDKERKVVTVTRVRHRREAYRR